jgi:hypothetical protein
VVYYFYRAMQHTHRVLVPGNSAAEVQTAESDLYRLRMSTNVEVIRRNIHFLEEIFV